MRILHYIPDLNGISDTLLNLMMRMVTATSRQNDSYLLTANCQQLNALTSLLTTHGIHVIEIKLSTARTAVLWSAYRQMNKALTLIQPDIVHIHGAWNIMLAIMERIARHDGYVTCVSTYGGMAPEILNIDFFKKRFLPLATYQAPMIRHCSSLIAINDKEWKDIGSLGLKKRVEIMPEEDTQLAMALISAYQKVIDSSYLRFITPDEEHLVEQCFIASTLEDVRDKAHKEEDREVRNTEGLNFRRIFFLAYDEDIMPQLLEGAVKLQIDIPQMPQVADIPRYANRKAKRRGAIRELPLPRRSIRVADDRVDEYQVIVSLLRSQKEGFNRLTYRHKAELYRLFRTLDFDEDIVGRELKRLHLKSFTKKIQKLFHEMYDLPKGYDIY